MRWDYVPDMLENRMIWCILYMKIRNEKCDVLESGIRVGIRQIGESGKGVWQ